MSVQQQMVDAAEQSGFEAGRQAERGELISWLRYLMTANRDARAREEPDRVMLLKNSTLGSIKYAVERGEHTVAARRERGCPDP